MKIGQLKIDNKTVGAGIMLGAAFFSASEGQAASFKDLKDILLANPHWEDISYHAIKVSKDNLAAIDNPEAFAKIGSGQLPVINDEILKTLQNDKALKESGFTIRAVKTEFIPQAIRVVVTSGFEDKNITAEFDTGISLAVRVEKGANYVTGNNQDTGVSQPLVVLDPAWTSLNITKFELIGIDLGKAKPILNKLFALLKNTISNAIRDKLDKTLYADLGIRPMGISNMTDISSEKVTFNSRPFNYHPVLSQAAFMINTDGLYAVADAVNLPQQAEVRDPLVPAPVEDYDNVKPSTRDLAFKMYELEFRSKFETDSGLTMQDNMILAVSQAYLAESINEIAKGEPISANVHVDTGIKAFKRDIILSDAKDLNCSEAFEACKFKNPCTRNDICYEVINQTLKVPPYPCGTLRHPRICDTVNVSTEILNPGKSIMCSSFAIALSGHQDLCASAGLIDASTCTTLELMEVTKCQGEESFRVYASKNPVGEIEGDYSLNGDVFASVLDLTMTPDLNAISAIVDAKGQVNADVRFKLTIKGEYAGIWHCDPSLSHAFETDISAETESSAVTFQFKEAKMDSTGNLDLVYQASEKQPVIFILRDSPLKFFSDPKKISSLACDLKTPLILGKIIPNIDAGTQTSAALSHNIPVEQKIDEPEFEIRLEPMDLEMEHNAIPLKPEKRGKVITYSPFIPAPQ